MNCGLLMKSLARRTACATVKLYHWKSVRRYASSGLRGQEYAAFIRPTTSVVELQITGT